MLIPRPRPRARLPPLVRRARGGTEVCRKVADIAVLNVCHTHAAGCELLAVCVGRATQPLRSSANWLALGRDHAGTDAAPVEQPAIHDPTIRVGADGLADAGAV